jgi:hypothetical protein
MQPTAQHRPLPAPLPEADLASAVRPFGESTNLPAAAYTSSAVLAWERRHLFAGSWTCLGRTVDLGFACSQRAVRVGGLGVLLTFARAESAGSPPGVRQRLPAPRARAVARRRLPGSAGAGLPVPRLVV